ncbi:hypothetical protein JHK84_033316 [Glycine max]|nr:hypothetical protein JHK87_032920 [Glycine soja]KAG4985378.1 hypothetical protein JHK86_033069 [Glycine max]KAG5139548.1 hypothetical protein JHK84_033316 [Glycine max]
MLLKDSLSEPDWLSEIHPLNEKASSLNESETQENVGSESSVLSVQPALLVRVLSLLALSAFKPA